LGLELDFNNFFTMKKTHLFITSIFLLFLSCEKPSECIESLGTIISKEIPVTPFTRIYVKTGIELVITQGLDYSVKVVTGGNLIDNIDVKQEGTTLYLSDNATCNWVRDYGTTIVYVTAPNLEEIYSKTDRAVRSNGILSYPIFRLFSLDSDGDNIEGAGTGDFFIEIDNSQLVIENNNVSRFFIKGKTDNLLLNFYAGDGRFEGANLNVKNADIFHRGTNDMIVKPIESITGKIVSVGDLILKNNPPIITVQELFQGQIIYN
jgi:hypothetical protein